MNLKELAKTGFRTKEIIVAEWQESKVVIREPSHVNFNQYAKEVKLLEENKKLSNTDRNTKLIEAEARLFITVLLDADNKVIFTDADIEDLTKTYGPIHTRLLDQAIELIGLGNNPVEAAEKKVDEDAELYFKLKLALRLGKTLAELESILTAREFYYWVAFDRINPIGDERSDLHAAQVASSVYQSQGAKISLSDCLLKFKDNKKEDDEPMDIGQAMFNLLGKHNGNS